MTGHCLSPGRDRPLTPPATADRVHPSGQSRTPTGRGFVTGHTLVTEGA